MRLGHLAVLSALLVTKAAANCSREDCETGLSIGVAAASTCATVAAVFCGVTFGLGCAVGLACGVAAGVADGSKEACRACGDGGGGAGTDADRLSNQINRLTLSVEQLIDQSIKIEGQIQLTQIIALYGQDITNYQKVRRAFKGLRKNSKGLIIRNLDSVSFEQAANNANYGLAASSMQIFQMMTGGHPLKAESIFQAVPDFCKNEAKNYFVKVMYDCYILECISRAMKGESMNPTRMLNFKKQLLLVEDQFIKDCGCPEGLVRTARKSNLPSSLVSLARSQPSGHCSSNVTYADQPVPSLIMDDSTDRPTLKKINLLYSIAPFSPAKSVDAKTIADTYSIEELKLAQYLSTSHSLADLKFYEGHLFCAKPDRVDWHGQCVKDTLNNRVLLYDGGRSNRRTPMDCIALCKNLGFLLAGVQHAQACLCGNTSPPKTALAPDSECSMSCPGDSSMKCGEAWRMKVYTTGCCNTLSVIGRHVPNGKYIRTSQLHNNRAVFKKGDSCIFYGRHWKIDGCAWLQAGDHSVGLIWSSVNKVYPESIGDAWRYYNWGSGGSSSGAVDKSISVSCIDGI